MKTLYASDLDGTLLTKEERVSPYSCEKLNRMIENGLLFTFATARSVSSARNAVRGLDVTAPVILYNGGLVYDFNAKRDLHSVLFADDVQTFTSVRIFLIQLTHRRFFKSLWMTISTH